MKKAYRIPDKEFLNVIKYTPLISIDFIIYNTDNEVLLGLRRNAPAKNFWFVPGGRILKDESLPEAFSRISSFEFGLNCHLHESIFKGIYEHIYPGENYFEDATFGTHYIVLAYEYKLIHSLDILPEDQHNAYKWMKIDDLLVSDKVHPNTKNYFNQTKSFDNFAR